jgi:hypothetical protein
VRKSRETINRVATQLIQEKKRMMEDGELSGKAYEGRDLLSLRSFVFHTIRHLVVFILTVNSYDI